MKDKWGKVVTLYLTVVNRGKCKEFYTWPGIHMQLIRKAE